MASVAVKVNPRVRRHRRVRKKVRGTADRPRLCVFRSLRAIYAQVIDDDADQGQGRTLAGAGSHERGLAIEAPPASGEQAGPVSGPLAEARAVGKAVAERAKAAGVTRVVFDRGGYLYHGRVKALAEAAREAGLEF